MFEMCWTWLEAQKYRYLWTSERSQWCLLEVLDHNGIFIGYLISQNGQGRLRIEDDDVSRYVKEQMLKSGTKIVSAKESMRETQEAAEKEAIRRRQLIDRDSQHN